MFFILSAVLDTTTLQSVLVLSKEYTLLSNVEIANIYLLIILNCRVGLSQTSICKIQLGQSWLSPNSLSKESNKLLSLVVSSILTHCCQRLAIRRMRVNTYIFVPRCYRNLTARMLRTYTTAYVL